MKKLFEKIKQNFEFFEKKQGRPSKETLRKRRTFYITLVLLFVLVLVGITNLTLSKINKNKLKGETTSVTTDNFIFAEGAYDNDENDYNYYVTRPTNVKYYKICFYLKNTAGNYEQITCTEENSDIDKFLLSPFSKEDNKKQYKISIQVFEDSNYTIVNKNVNTWKPNGWNTNSIDNSAYAEFTINPSTHETCINDEVEDGKVNSNIVGSYLSVFKRIINFLYRIFGQEPPYKVNTDTEQLGIVQKVPDIEETSDISNVTAEKTYNTAFELKNTYNSKAYYKIVKYKSINLKPENLIDKGTCLPFNGKSVNVKTSFNISRTNKEAAGVLKVFLSKELCEAEDGDYTKAFTQSITKYKYTGSTATTKTTTTTKKTDIEPKMKLSSITAYGKNLGTSTVKKTVSGKEYNVHEIKNSGQVNLVYNATTGVKNADSYYRRLNLYKSFDGKTVSYSSTCRKYNEFDGEAKDDFVMNSDNKTVRTEFVIYSDANCTKEVNNKKTTDYFLYTGSTITDNDTVTGKVKLTAYGKYAAGNMVTACEDDTKKLKNAIYKDKTYGDVRIIASNKLKNDYGCGTIVELKGEIQLENKTVSSVKAIVLDTGETKELINGTVFDLMLNCDETGYGSLKCSGKEMYYSNPTVTYKVLRKGGI